MTAVAVSRTADGDVHAQVKEAKPGSLQRTELCQPSQRPREDRSACAINATGGVNPA
jgi:hypothetical protein